MAPASSPMSCLVLAMGFPGASHRALCSQPWGVIVVGEGGHLRWGSGGSGNWGEADTGGVNAASLGVLKASFLGVRGGGEIKIRKPRPQQA